MPRDVLWSELPRLPQGKIDLNGQHIGRFTVLEQIEEARSGSNLVWKVKCECGTIEEKSTQSLRLAGTKFGCKDCVKTFGRSNSENDELSCINIIWYHVRRAAINRGIKFSLTKEQVRSTIVRNCQYCGMPPAARIIHPLSISYAYHGIDRVNNLKGYEIENVVPACTRCNRAKGEMTVDEFKSWAKRVYLFMNHA